LRAIGHRISAAYRPASPWRRCATRRPGDRCQPPPVPCGGRRCRASHAIRQASCGTSACPCRRTPPKNAKPRLMGPGPGCRHPVGMLAKPTADHCARHCCTAAASHDNLPSLNEPVRDNHGAGTTAAGPASWRQRLLNAGGPPGREPGIAISAGCKKQTHRDLAVRTLRPSRWRVEAESGAWLATQCRRARMPCRLTAM